MKSNNLFFAIMKTKSLWIAIAALAMTGCSQNEIMEMSPDANPAVGFGIFTGAQTKGTVTNNDATGTGVKVVGFGVLAAYTGQDDWTSTEPNFMYNQQVTWSSTAWTYSPLKYWPKASGDKISFWAYAPYDDNNSKGIALSASNAKTAPKITFEVKDNPTEMVDLVAGCAMNQTKPGDATVSFNLKHVLSKVVFHAKVSEELFNASNAAKKTHIFITKAELLGDEVFTKAGYNFSTNNATANDTWDYTGATNANPAAMDITNVLNLKTNNNIGKTTPYTTHAVDLTTTTASSIFKDNQYLFLIPAATGGISQAGKAQVKFTYDIVTEDSNLAIGYSKTTSTVTADLTASTLKKGVAYKYTFTFGVDAIKVSATASDWATDTEQPITPNL